MGEKSFVIPLGDSNRDRYRLFRRTEKGQVLVFRVQYEALIEGKWRPVVRYDTAHGYPHRDMLHPDGSQEKAGFPQRTNAEVLTLGQEDIKRNWQTYREQYELEMSK